MRTWQKVSLIAVLAAVLAVINMRSLPMLHTLTVTLSGVDDAGRILPKHAFCVADAKTHSRAGGNVSPEIFWSAGPEGTQSYAILMHDPDVPTVFDDANKADKTLAADMPRKDFVHWVLVDIPATTTALAEGADSKGVKKPGKPAGKTPHGVRGVNDYGAYLGGVFAGYDGPCPPWNDARLHHYTYNVYALDVPTLGLSGEFTRADALKAMEGHVLAEGQAVGIYTQNPGL